MEGKEERRKGKSKARVKAKKKGWDFRLGFFEILLLVLMQMRILLHLVKMS